MAVSIEGYVFVGMIFIYFVVGNYSPSYEEVVKATNKKNYHQENYKRYQKNAIQVLQHYKKEKRIYMDEARKYARAGDKYSDDIEKKISSELDRDLSVHEILIVKCILQKGGGVKATTEEEYDERFLNIETQCDTMAREHDGVLSENDSRSRQAKIKRYHEMQKNDEHDATPNRLMEDEMLNKFDHLSDYQNEDEYEIKEIDEEEEENKKMQRDMWKFRQNPKFFKRDESLNKTKTQ